MDDSELRAEIKKILYELKIPPALDPFMKFNISQEVSDRLTPLLLEIGESDSEFNDVLADSASYLSLAVLCYLRGQYEHAARYAEKALRSPDRAPDARFVQAMAYFRLQNLKKAIGYFDSILDSDKRNWLAWFFKGEALRMRSLFDRAVDAYRMALALEKNRSEPWISLGHALTDIGRMEDAAKAYVAGMKCGDSGGRAQKIQQMMEEATTKRLPQLFEKILKLAPDMTEAQFALARHYRANRDYKNAMKCYGEILRIQPDNAKARKEYDETNLAWKKTHTCRKCSGSGKCKKCDGDGLCTVCYGSGKCGECDGKKGCVKCDGTGKCPDCRGKGKVRLFKTCPTCRGSGKCTKCKGKAKCTACKGTGKCTTCTGSKKCTVCEGSGKCTECKGEGWKDPAGEKAR